MAAPRSCWPQCHELAQPEQSLRHRQTGCDADIRAGLCTAPANPHPLLRAVQHFGLIRPQAVPAKFRRAKTEHPQRSGCVRAGCVPTAQSDLLSRRKAGSAHHRHLHTPAGATVLLHSLPASRRAGRAGSAAGGVGGSRLRVGGCTHRVGCTSGTAPSRSSTVPRGPRTFLTEEIFSRSKRLMRLKPGGRRG